MALEAKALLEKMANRSKVLRPAIAGLIVDKSVNYREVFATFVQLVVNGYADRVYEKTFIRSNKRGNLYRFEELVLKSVFPDERPVTESDVIARLKNIDLGSFSLVLMDELVEQGIADKNTKFTIDSQNSVFNANSQMDVQFDERPGTHSGRVVKRVVVSKVSIQPIEDKDALFSPFFRGGIKVGGADNHIGGKDVLRELSKEAPEGTQKTFFSKKVSCSIKAKDPKEAEEIMNKMKLGTFPVPGEAKYKMLVDGKEITDPEEIEKHRRLFEATRDSDRAAFSSGARGSETRADFAFNDTEKARRLVQEYIELQEYLKKYPLFEDRFSNEFVAYNVAFHLRDCETLPR